MNPAKIMPFIFFLAALSASSGKHLHSAENKTGFSLLSNPFVEARYKKNFVAGDATADPDTFRIKTGTDGANASVYGKKKDGEAFEFTSFKAGVFPFADNRLMIHFFYGSISYNGFASRIRNPPGKTTSVVYYPVVPTKSLFFSQSTASEKTSVAADLFFGNWRLAFCGDTQGLGDEHTGGTAPAWFSGGWSGKTPFLSNSTLSVMVFGGKNTLPEKNATSWFPDYHRENPSESIYAGAEIAYKAKYFSASALFSAAEGTLRPDGFHIRADAAVYGKHGRLAFFYSKTDRDYAALSGSKTPLIERAGFSPYVAWTFTKKRWVRLTAGTLCYTAVEKGEAADKADASHTYVGGYASAATLTSSVTARIKKEETRLQIEGTAKSAALLSRRLVLETSVKSVFEDGGRTPDTTKITGSATFRSTLHRSIGMHAERRSEDNESEYSVSALFTERISAGPLRTDLSCTFSVHTDDRKFSGNVAAKLILK